VSTETLDPVDGLAKLWAGYSRGVYGPDYPLYQMLSAAVSGDRRILEMIAGCPPEAHDPNLFMAAVQYLVMEGAPHRLGRYYRGEPVSPEEASAALADFTDAYADRIRALLSTRHVQTNETGRCGGLAVGLVQAAELIGSPIALIDDGASAGLNLCLDEYLIDFGPAGRTGPSDSPVLIRSEWRGAGRPDLDVPVIAHRLGIDRVPVDTRDSDTARWMLACIWPGNDRQDRARAAMEIAARRPAVVRRGDMVEDLAPALQECRAWPTVVVTSWSFSYLSIEARARFRAVLQDEGRTRPVAWVCLDILGVDDIFEPPAPPADIARPMPSILGLAVFDRAGVEARTLGFIHSHGTWIHWLG
jgi:hypothetical protein